MCLRERKHRPAPPGHAPTPPRQRAEHPAGTRSAGPGPGGVSEPRRQGDGLDPGPASPRPPGPPASPRPAADLRLGHRSPPGAGCRSPATGLQEVEGGAPAHTLSFHSLLLSDAHTQTDQSWHNSAVRVFRLVIEKILKGWHPPAPRSPRLAPPRVTLTSSPRCPLDARPGSDRAVPWRRLGPADWSDTLSAWVLAAGQEARDRGSEEHGLLPAWRRCQSPIPRATHPRYYAGRRLEAKWWALTALTSATCAPLCVHGKEHLTPETLSREEDRV